MADFIASENSKVVQRVCHLLLESLENVHVVSVGGWVGSIALVQPIIGHTPQLVNTHFREKSNLANLPTMSPEEQEARAQAVAMIAQGYSYREAQESTGVPLATLHRTIERAGTDVPDLFEEIRAKAAEAASKGVKRMNREIESTPDRNVAQWTLATAKLAGMLEAQDASRSAGLGELLERLSGAGNTVSVGVRVEPKQGQR